ETENGEELISPCKCEGSQKYIHLSCLRRWQRTVQLGSSNHPEDRGAEDRHLVCNVCRGIFNLPPQDRGALLSDLAGAQPSDVATGLLLVTKRSAGESLASSSLDNLAIRAFLEAKAAHFRSAVYILTDISPG
ncbi:SSM4, partial [Symbiodinium necroappetens]